MQHPTVLKNNLHDTRRQLMVCLRMYSELNTETQDHFRPTQVLLQTELAEIMRILRLFECQAPPSDGYVTHVTKSALQVAKKALVALTISMAAAAVAVNTE